MLSRCQILCSQIFSVLKKQIGKWDEIKSRKLLSQKFRCSCFIFKEDHLFIEGEGNPSDNVVTFVDELHGYDVDGIRNFLDLPRLMFINLLINKMGILKQSLMTERLLEKIALGSSQKFYKPIDFNSLTKC